MPLFKVDIQKKLGEEYWTNTYTVNESTIQAARDVGLLIVNQERNFHLNVVVFDRLRVSTPVEGDNEFIIVPLSELGRRDTFEGEVLPLFNTLAVLYGTGVGRVGRRYYRGCLNETDVFDGRVVLTLISDVGLYTQNILSFGVAKANGTPYTTATPVREVAMRQLRRGSKRRLRPII